MQPWQNPELDEVRDTFRRVGEQALGGDWLQLDRDGVFSRERWQEAARSGFLGVCVHEANGGAGRPVAHAAAAIEGLSYGCGDSGLVYGLTSQLVGVEMTLQVLASEDLQRRYLPKLVSGELLAAHAFTEVGAGSDAFSMATTAVKDGDDYVITGRKSYITNAPNADIALVFAKTGDRGPFSLTAFLVDLSAAGVSRGTEFEKLGLRTINMGELVFDEVRVPADHVVGRVGGGLVVVTESTGWERALLMAAALGPMQRTLEEVVDRTREREQFGKPIGAFQQVSAKVADMAVQVHLSRLLTYDIAAKLGHGSSVKEFAKDAAMTKLFVSESFKQLELDAVQVFGVRGYLVDNVIQQRLRDSLSGTIYAGTSEVMRNIIARFAGVPTG